MRDLLAAAADLDPRLRLAASELADACFRAHEAEPIALPDGAVLARTELARLAGQGGSTTAARRPSRHREGSARGARVGRVVVVGAVVVSGLLAFAFVRGGAHDVSTIGTPQVGDTSGAGAASARPAVAPAATAEHDGTRPDPVEAARRLTALRAGVISSGDAAALTSVEVPGSLAATGDAATMTDLAARGVRVDGLTVEVSGADLVAATGDQARVAVTSATSAYRQVRSDGEIDTTVPAGGRRTVVLLLQLVADGWRVADVLEPDARDLSSATGRTP